MRNIRRVRRTAIVPVLSVTRTTTMRNELPSTPNRSTDRQLFLMLFMDIIFYIIFSFMLSSVTLYEQLTQYSVKSPVQSFTQIRSNIYQLNINLYWMLYEFSDLENI
jgi:hypothetical protein